MIVKTSPIAEIRPKDAPGFGRKRSLKRAPTGLHAAAAWHQNLPEALFLLATTVAGFLGRGRWLTPEADTGAWWSLFERLARGDRLYRDVYPNEYGPLSPYLLAAGARLFGSSAAYFLLATWVAAILAGLLLLYAARPLLSTFERTALAGLLIGTSVLAPGHGRLVFAYAPAAVHALAFSVTAFLCLPDKNSGRGRAVLAGLFAGLAFCCKQEIGAAAAIGLWAAPLAARRKPFAWMLGTAAGFVAAVAPAALFAFTSAPVESLRRDSGLWPLLLRLPGDWRSAFRWVAGLDTPDWAGKAVSSFWTLLASCAILAALGLVLSGQRRSSRWFLVSGLALGLVIWWVLDRAYLGRRFSPIMLSTLVAIVVAGAAFFQRPLENRERIAAVATFGALVSLRTVFSADVGHHYAGVAHFPTALTWALLICVFFPLWLCGARDASAPARRVFAISFFVASWLSVSRGVAALDSPYFSRVRTPQGSVFVKNPSFFQLIEKNVRPHERVLALPEPSALEPLYGVRGWAPRLLWLPPSLDRTREAELIERLEKDPPDAVVVFFRPTPEYRVAPLGKGYGVTLWEWLSKHSRVVASSPGGTIFRPLREPDSRR
jgi:hypothetical protein